jgi:hypothetical protein
MFQRLMSSSDEANEEQQSGDDAQSNDQRCRICNGALVIAYVKINSFDSTSAASSEDVRRLISQVRVCSATHVVPFPASSFRRCSVILFSRHIDARPCASRRTA